MVVSGSHFQTCKCESQVCTPLAVHSPSPHSHKGPAISIPAAPHEHGAPAQSKTQEPRGPARTNPSQPRAGTGLVGSASRRTFRPPPGLQMQENVLSPFGENAGMLVKMPLWIVMFACVYHQKLLRGSQGRLQMSEMGPGNFLPQRLCFLSLLLLREQVEALLGILS